MNLFLGRFRGKSFLGLDAGAIFIWLAAFWKTENAVEANGISCFSVFETERGRSSGPREADLALLLTKAGGTVLSISSDSFGDSNSTSLRCVGVSRPLRRVIWRSRNCCSLNCFGLLKTPMAVAFPLSFGLIAVARTFS